VNCYVLLVGLLTVSGNIYKVLDRC